MRIHTGKMKNSKKSPPPKANGHTDHKALKEAADALLKAGATLHAPITRKPASEAPKPKDHRSVDGAKAPHVKADLTRAQQAWEDQIQLMIESQVRVSVKEIIKVDGPKGTWFIWYNPQSEQWVYSQALTVSNPMGGSKLKERVVEWAKRSVIGMLRKPN